MENFTSLVLDKRINTSEFIALSSDEMDGFETDCSGKLSSSSSSPCHMQAEEEIENWDEVNINKHAEDAEEQVSEQSNDDEVETDESSLFFGLNMKQEKYDYYCKNVCDEYHDDFWETDDWYMYFRWNVYSGPQGWRRM